VNLLKKMANVYLNSQKAGKTIYFFISLLYNKNTDIKPAFKIKDSSAENMNCVLADKVIFNRPVFAI